jgi:hypothetical protein
VKETKSSQEKILKCKDCETPFTWSAGEQAFYSEKGFGAPKRCPDCRAYLKRKMNAGHRTEVQHG